jgi:hypothetical protein
MTRRRREPRPRTRSRRPWWTRLAGPLLLVLVALGAYLALSGGSGSGSGPSCLGRGSPEVRLVSAATLSPLRASVARVLPQRVGRLYEEGTVTAGVAFSDDSPSPPAVSPTARRPGGYEMRWWAPNGDDVVADVFVFSGPHAAQHFLELASGARCRHSGRIGSAAHPPLARNLAWVNPDGFGQADVYLSRGDRVYRIADVPAGQRGTRGPSETLGRALQAVDALACLLPHAHCTVGSSSVVPA